MYCLWRLSRGEGFIYVLPVKVIKRRGFIYVLPVEVNKWRGVYISIACGGYQAVRGLYLY
jgi:hypothetical protein